jgi:hypothetical protein
VLRAHNKRLRLRTDLSYGGYIYAFPMQQLLVICGLAILNPIDKRSFQPLPPCRSPCSAGFGWRSAMSHKSRLKRSSAAPTEDRRSGQTVSGYSSRN